MVLEGGENESKERAKGKQPVFNSGSTTYSSSSFLPLPSPAKKQKLRCLDSPDNYCETLCCMPKLYSWNCLIKTNCIVVFKDYYLKKSRLWYQT